MSTIKTNDQDGIVILEFFGRVVQETCDELEEVFSKVYEDDPASQIVLDFSEVHHICSAALGVMISFKKKFKLDGGDIRLVVTNDDLLELFETTMLNRVFEIHSLPEEAVSAYLDSEE